MDVRIGCAGWSIPREFMTHFPSEGSHLERYSQVFNCCEINSSFYRSHKKETWRKWADAVPGDFRFSVKAPKTLTHAGELKCDRKILSSFFSEISSLGHKLGPVLFQLPPRLRFESEKATKFLFIIRAHHSGEVVWEPRHPSWFNDPADDLLKHFKIARAAADPACVPAASVPGGTKGLVYFRLHGSPRRYYSSYDELFLDNIIPQISKAETPWCIFDNTALGSATGNALQLSEKTRKPDFAEITGQQTG
jgi:uncharacterized protein YecE (DUF72 family)